MTLDAGHPATGPVEPDGGGLLGFQGHEPLLVGFPAVAEVVDGWDGGDFGHVGLVGKAFVSLCSSLSRAFTTHLFDKPLQLPL